MGRGTNYLVVGGGVGGFALNRKITSPHITADKIVNVSCKLNTSALNSSYYSGVYYELILLFVE